MHKLLHMLKKILTMTNVQHNLQYLTIVFNEKNSSQHIKQIQLNSRNTISSYTHFSYKKLV